MAHGKDDILKSIDFYLKVRDYMINAPAGDYQLHLAATELVINKLDALQKQYRVFDAHFLWSDYQFHQDHYLTNLETIANTIENL